MVMKAMSGCSKIMKRYKYLMNFKLLSERKKMLFLIELLKLIENVDDEKIWLFEAIKYPKNTKNYYK